MLKPLSTGLILVALLGICGSVHAATVSVSLNVSPRSISIADSFNIQVKVQGASTGIEWPDFRKAKDFTIAGGPSTFQSTQIRNNRRNITATSTFVAKPLRAGTIKIPPVSIKVNGRIYKSRAGTSLVVREIVKDDDFFLKLSTSREVVYPDQLFNVILKIYAREGIGSYRAKPPFIRNKKRGTWPQLQLPWLAEKAGFETTSPTEFLQGLSPTLENRGFPINNYQNSGFFQRSLLKFVLKQQTETRTASDGRKYRYFVYTLQKSYRALKPGGYTFAPATARGTIVNSRTTNNRLKNQQLVARSNSLAINVKNVPRQDRPTSFSGAIGKFNIRATVKPKKVWVGEPMTLHLVVRGTGRLEPIAPIGLREQPKIDEIFRIQEPDTGEIAEDGRSKKFTYSLRPNNADITAVPPIEFSYFDPAEEKFRVAKTVSLPITVEEGNEVDTSDVQSFSGDFINNRRRIQAVEEAVWPVYNKPDALVGQLPVSLVSWTQMGLLALPPFLYFALLMATLRRRKLNADPSILRARGAVRRSREFLEQAEKATQAGQGAEVYQEIARALLGLLADRTNRPAAGMTPMDAANLLEEREAPEELRQSVSTLLETCEQARYGAPVGKENLAEEVSRAKGLIDQLEKTLR